MSGSRAAFFGALTPSEMLDRASGKTSVVVFSYHGEEWSGDHATCSVTAYLVEFPRPIEPVRRPSELPCCPESTWEPANRFAEFAGYEHDEASEHSSIGTGAASRQTENAKRPRTE